MKKAKWLILLVAFWTSLSFADYAQDKETCATWGGNLSLFAELRDEGMARDTLIDKTLAVADKEGWPAEAVVGMLYLIQFAYAHPEVTPAKMKNQAYDACMKRRGHTKT